MTTTHTQLSVHLTYTMLHGDRPRFVAQKLFTDEHGEEDDFTHYISPDDLDASSIGAKEMGNTLTRTLAHVLALMHPQELITLTLTVTPPLQGKHSDDPINWDDVAE